MKIDDQQTARPLLWNIRANSNLYFKLNLRHFTSNIIINYAVYASVFYSSFKTA